jgi:hypothetical protein
MAHDSPTGAPVVHEPHVSCGRRALDPRPIEWAKVITEFEHNGERLVFRPMDVGDARAVAALYAAYYPHLYASTRHDFLDETFYPREAAMLSRWDEDARTKPYFFGVVERTAAHEATHEATHKIVGVFGCLRDPHDRVAQNLAVVITPALRGQALTHHFSRYYDDLFERSGADCVWGTIDAKDVITQRFSFFTGCHVGGFMPGVFRWSYDRRTYYRDMLLYFYKLYNGAEAYTTRPSDWVVDPKAVAELRSLLDQLTPPAARPRPPSGT